MILKEDAANQNSFKEFQKYDNDLDDLEEQIQAEEIQFKVKTFEQRIDLANKEKVIAQQGRDLAKSNINVVILLGILFAILLFVWILSLRRRGKQAAKEQYLQEQFTQQLLQNTEEERSRIANELHDGVNHHLLTIKNNIITDQKIQAEDIGEIIEEVRNISRNLHPSILQTAGFEVAVNNLCDKTTDAGLFTTCDIEYAYKLSKNKELQMYRIVQEALNNTLKHGKANAAKVILTSQDNFLHLEIKDNGSGFDVEAQMNNSKSFGLQSILQRAKAIMAKVNIQSTTKGTVILIKIPVQ